MDFLNEKNSSIYKTNNVVSSLSNKMKLIKQFTKANIVFININTRKQYPNTSETLSENTIYKSFIIYCKI